MRTNWKPYLFDKKKDDGDFANGVAYGRVRLGNARIYWELGFRWYGVEISRIERVYRRVEDTLMQVGCRPGVQGIQKLVLILTDGTKLELQIGEGNKETVSEGLYLALQLAHPYLKYGKSHD